METLLIGVHVLAAIVITGLVLIQHGKGADMGASFGSGASQTMFGSTGTGNFLTKSTTLLTAVFFITSLGLAIVAKQRAEMGVQDDSLISGDVNEFIVPPEQNSVDTDIPSVNNAGSDIPETTQDNQEQ